MPIPSYNADQPAAVCCEVWWTLVENITVLAGNAVNDCLGPVCDPIPFYVTHSEPIGSGDYLAGWLAQVTVGQFDQTTPLYGALPPTLTINLAVSLSNYPGIEWGQGGNLLAVPGASEYMRATYFTYGVAERMWRTVVNESVKGTSSVFGKCARVNVGQLIPQAPADYSARWGMQIAATL